MDADFLMQHPIQSALGIVIMAIFVDAILGALKAWRVDGNFDIRVLPQFLATNILPYATPLTVLAGAAAIVGEPFRAIFYASAVPALAKYLAEIKDKLSDFNMKRLKAKDKGYNTINRR